MNQQIGELRNFIHTISNRMNSIETTAHRTEEKVNKAIFGLEIIRDKQFHTDSIVWDKKLQTLDESELRTVRILFGSSPPSMEQILPPKGIISDDILGQLGLHMGGDDIDTIEVEDS